jgi:hypothetical protein
MLQLAFCILKINKGKALLSFAPRGASGFPSGQEQINLLLKASLCLPPIAEA